MKKGAQTPAARKGAVWTSRQGGEESRVGVGGVGVVVKKKPSREPPGKASHT